jgi:SAM-dependent methyltransferase
MIRHAEEYNHDAVRWWHDHFERAAATVVDFLESDAITLEGKVIADVGCGDGIIDLGVLLKGKPAKLVGYDLQPVDVDALLRAAEAAGVLDELPSRLSFAVSDDRHVPAPDDTFDIAFSWSTFEHVSHPVVMLREIARILKPGGVLFLQLWPFFLSEHGGHLWPHYDVGFAHLLKNHEELLEEIMSRRGTDPSRPADDEYRSLNRLTLDGLQRATLVAGLRPRKLRLMTETVHVPDELAHLPFADLGVGGIELLAEAPDERATKRTSLE